MPEKIKENFQKIIKNQDNEIIFYENPNQNVIASCNNSTRSSQLNAMVINSNIDLEKLDTNMKCESKTIKIKKKFIQSINLKLKIKI